MPRPRLAILVFFDLNVLVPGVGGGPLNRPNALSMLSECLFPTKNSQLALKTGVPVGNIHNVIIWGNHSATQYPDAEHGYVTNTPAPGLTLVRPTPFFFSSFVLSAFVCFLV